MLMCNMLCFRHNLAFKNRMTGFRVPVKCLRNNRAGSILATERDDSTVRLWSVEGVDKNELVLSLGPPHPGTPLTGDDPLLSKLLRMI